MVNESLHCSFCGRAQIEVKHLIRGNHGAFICQECVGECTDLIEEAVKSKKKTAKEIITPEAIVRHLDEHVIGQVAAKRALAIAAYNHLKRIGGKLDAPVDKSNVLLIGPSASGKTMLCQTLAKFLDVPIVIADMTQVSENGYIGVDFDQVLGRLVLAANGDVQRAQKGILVLDEFCKIASSDSLSRDVKGTGVQQTLLKVIEGSVIAVNPKGDKITSGTQTVDLDTSNILFVAAGAFSQLTDIKNKKHRALGFGDIVASSVKKVIEPEDIIKFGMIPEIVGRLPIISELERLTEAELVNVLFRPKHSLVRQYQTLLAADGVALEFTEGFLLEAARQAYRLGTGARALRGILEAALGDIMFSAPTDKPQKVVVDESFLCHSKEISTPAQSA